MFGVLLSVLNVICFGCQVDTVFTMLCPPNNLCMSINTCFYMKCHWKCRTGNLSHYNQWINCVMWKVSLLGTIPLTIITSCPPLVTFRSCFITCDFTVLFHSHCTQQLFSAAAVRQKDWWTHFVLVLSYFRGHELLYIVVSKLCRNYVSEYFLHVCTWLPMHD